MQTKNNLQDLYLDYPHERSMGEWKYGLFEKEKKTDERADNSVEAINWSSTRR